MDRIETWRRIGLVLTVAPIVLILIWADVATPPRSAGILGVLCFIGLAIVMWCQMVQSGQDRQRDRDS